MDHNVSAAVRHFDAQEDAAERAHSERMLTIYFRLDAIECQIAALRAEEAALRTEVCQALGVYVNDVITQQDGRRALVQTVKGGFFMLPEDPPRISATVTCWCSPETATGFHARKHVWHTEIDDTVIPLPKADEQWKLRP